MDIPSVLNHYNVYSDGEKLIGAGNDLELPELVNMTDDLDGTAILGTLEEPATGQFESMEMTIKWEWLDKKFFRVGRTSSHPQFTIRASQQVTDSRTGMTDYKPIKIVVRGKNKSINLGTFSKAKKIAPETKIEIAYIKIVIGGEVRLELDKLNFKYILNGIDMMKKIRRQI